MWGYAFQRECLPSKLSSEIQSREDITIALGPITYEGGQTIVNFKAELPDADEIALNEVVDLHDPTPNQTDETLTVKLSEDSVPKFSLSGFRDLSGHNYWKKSFFYEIDLDDEDGIITLGESFSSFLYLSGGGYKILDPIDTGTNIEFLVIDENNILGYGPGFQVAEFVSQDYVWEGKEWEMRTDDAKLVPPGLFFTFRIHIPREDQSSSSSSASGLPRRARVIVWYNFRTA